MRCNAYNDCISFQLNLGLTETGEANTKIGFRINANDNFIFLRLLCLRRIEILHKLTTDGHKSLLYLPAPTFGL